VWSVGAASLGSDAGHELTTVTPSGMQIQPRPELGNAPMSVRIVTKLPDRSEADVWRLVLEMRSDLMSYQAIVDVSGLSKGRVAQILRDPRRRPAR